RPPPRSTLFPYTTLFRSGRVAEHATAALEHGELVEHHRTMSADVVGCIQASCHPIALLSCNVAACGLDGPEIGRGRRRPTELGRSEEHTSELQSRENLVC